MINMILTDQFYALLFALAWAALMAAILLVLQIKRYKFTVPAMIAIGVMMVANVIFITSDYFPPIPPHTTIPTYTVGDAVFVMSGVE